MQQGRIAAARGHQCGHLPIAVIEDDAIEDAVDDVPQGAREDHGDADDVAHGVLFPNELHQVVGDAHHGHDAEDGEDEFVEELHAECHAGVLREVELEPGEDGDAFTQRHVRLHPNLEGLVQKKEQQDDRRCSPSLSCSCLFVHFTPLCLASMLNVAWGTARSRSFEISFPVSRQMP